MISRIIEASVRNRFLVLALAGAAGLWGVTCLLRTPIDAIPDLSENQVIVWADWPGRSPKEVEDQVTYPLSVGLQGLAGVKAVRATSEFGFSMIHVIFDDSIDFYFARQRILERLSTGRSLPEGVVPYLAPDATALGQIFAYTVEGEGRSLAELRSIQDWSVRYSLSAVPGVAEVAGVGGFVREYQVDVNSGKLRAYDVSLGDVFRAVLASNSSVGGKVMHKGGSEYLIRGTGWLKSLEDLRDVVVAERGGVPLTVDQVATVQLGPAFRRGVLEKDGGEAVGGVVLMRHGENPLAVTARVKEEIGKLSLPRGVRLVPFYDRTGLIHASIETLRNTLILEILVVSLVVFLVLRHVRSAFVICVTLPLAVLVSFIFMHSLNIPSNILSLAGIAISIGVLVDAAIVMTENAHHRLRASFQGEPVRGDTRPLVIEACKVVGRPLFFSIVIMLLSFAPIFALGGMEGKMFNPLACTKSFALVAAAFLAITVVPALIPGFVRGRLRSQDDVWMVRSFANVYRSVLDYFLRRPDGIVVLTGLFMIAALPLFPLESGLLPKAPYRFFVLAVPFIVGASALLVARRKVACLLIFLVAGSASYRWLRPLGEEFMPPLNELAILDMPTSRPNLNITQAGHDLKVRNEVLRGFPEVHRVVGKAGRAETALDPAPVDMIETVVSFRPEEEWPRRAIRERDAREEAREVTRALSARGLLKPAPEADDFAGSLVAEALARTDRAMRERCVRRRKEGAPERGGPLPRGHVRELDRELEARALGDLVAHLLEGAVAQARAEGRLAREARDEDLQALREERTKRFAKSVFLWRKTQEEIRGEMDSELQVPGWGNIWTRPIQNRVDMLATGVRTQVGVRITGRDADPDRLLATLQRLGEDVKHALFQVRGAADVTVEPLKGENYLEIAIDRKKAARYGVNVEDLHGVVEVALGGKEITTVIDGPARSPVRVRYARDFRADDEDIGNILVPAGPRAAEAMGDSLASALGSPGRPEPTGEMAALAATAVESPMTGEIRKDANPIGTAFGTVAHIPLSLLADVRVVPGPAMIRSENGRKRAYVYLNVRDRDVAGFVEEARQTVASRVELPKGYSIDWTGQYEHQVRVRNTLTWVFPAVLLIILVILFLTYRDLADTLMMFLAVPGAIAGGAILQAVFGIPFSTAVQVGYVACFGLATETGIVMLVYLREAIERRGGLEKIRSEQEIKAAVMEGAVARLRPKLLTEGTTVLALLPMLWATGVGAEFMKPMAVPILGGILVADEVIDLFLPVLFYRERCRRLRKRLV